MVEVISLIDGSLDTSADVRYAPKAVGREHFLGRTSLGS
jgi:hypothetical protein